MNPCMIIFQFFEALILCITVIINIIISCITVKIIISCITVKIIISCTTITVTRSDQYVKIEK